MSLRRTLDINLQQVVNLPAAGASASTPSVNLGTGPHLERLEVRVTLPATPDLVEAKDITITLEDSADGESFAAIPELAAPVVTGAAEAAGGDALEHTVRLPSSFRGHLRATVAVEAGGGDDNTDVVLTLDILQ